MAKHYNRNSKGRTLRDDGSEALYSKGDPIPKKDLFSRVLVEDRNRIDEICCKDGPMPIHAAIHQLIELYDFMLGKKPEPDWLPRRQNVYKKRGEAGPAGST